LGSDSFRIDNGKEKQTSLLGDPPQWRGERKSKRNESNLDRRTGQESKIDDVFKKFARLKSFVALNALSHSYKDSLQELVVQESLLMSNNSWTPVYVEAFPNCCCPEAHIFCGNRILLTVDLQTLHQSIDEPML